MKLFILALVASVSGQNVPIITAQTSNAQIITSATNVSNNTVVEFDGEDTDLVNVECSANKMCMTIDPAYFTERRGHDMDMETVQLQSSCNGVTETLASGGKRMCTDNIDTNACGLQMSTNQTTVSFATEVITGESTLSFPNGNMTIVSYRIPFACHYPLDYLLTLESELGDKYGHYIPQIYTVKIITLLGPGFEGIGQFPVSMMLYADEQYNVIHSSAPVKNVSDTLYFAILLADKPESATVQARECWATPDANVDNQIRANLINDYCSTPVANPGQDPSVEITQNGVSNYARWNMKAFKFAGDEFDKVYVHCWARICFEGVDGETCDKAASCGANGRKRRAIEQMIAPSEREGEAILTVGPITLTPDVLEILGGLANKPDEPKPVDSSILALFLDPVIGTVAIVSLVVIIAILVGLIFVVTRRQLNNQSAK